MIKSIEIKLNLLHKTVVEIMTNGETIGYIVNTDNKEKPHSLVNSKGANVGDYDCPKCAIDAAARLHLGVSDDVPSEFAIKGRQLAGRISISITTRGYLWKSYFPLSRHERLRWNIATINTFHISRHTMGFVFVAKKIFTSNTDCVGMKPVFRWTKQKNTHVIYCPHCNRSYCD